MPLQHRLTNTARRLATLATALVLTVAVSTVAADPARAALCSSNTARGSVPSDFAIEACVDTTSIWLHNSLHVPVRLTTSGDVGGVVKVTIDASLASLATRAVYNDPLLLLPSDVLRVPYGAGKASATLADTQGGGFYVLAVTLATFVPLGKVKDVYEAFTSMIKSIFDAFVSYQFCLAHNNWIGQIGCNVTLSWSVGAAVVWDGAKVALAVMSAGPARIVSLLLDGATWASFIAAQAPDIGAILHSNRTISLAAAPVAGPPAPPAGLPCPGGSTFRSAFNSANGPANTMDYFNVVRGPKCVPGWAASYGTTGLNGSGQELTRCGWEVLRERNGAWAHYDFVFQYTQPCDPAHPDTSALKDGSLKMCKSEVPAAIRSFLGC